MKLLTLIILLGRLLTVTAPQSVSAPDVSGVLAQMYQGSVHIVYAHSYLEGTSFYSLSQGDKVTGIFSDGSSQVYQVAAKDHFIASGTDVAATGTNFDVNVYGQWMPLSEATRLFYSPGGIVLFTCYSYNNGFSVTTGRLMVKLVPIVEIDPRGMQ